MTTNQIIQETIGHENTLIKAVKRDQRITVLIIAATSLLVAFIPYL